MTHPAIVHAFVQAAATATATATGVSPMQLIGVATGVGSFLLMFSGIAIYAYKLGGINRDMKATKDAAVNSTDALTKEVNTGFKSVHRRLDQQDEKLEEARRSGEERRDEWTQWRGTITSDVNVAKQTAERAARRAHRAISVTQGVQLKQENHEGRIKNLESEEPT